MNPITRYMLKQLGAEGMAYLLLVATHRLGGRLEVAEDDTTYGEATDQFRISCGVDPPGSGNLVVIVKEKVEPIPD